MSIESGGNMLEYLKERLEELKPFESIGVSIGGMVHDLNNSLTALIGNLSLARMVIDPFRADLLENITDAEKAAVQIRSIVQKMSAFSAPGRPSCENISVNEILREVVSSLNVPDSIEVNINSSQGKESVFADRRQISRVFEYVIQNALDAMPDGGKLDFEIKFSGEGEGRKYAAVTIKDSGEGIDGYIISRIFEPCFTTREGHSGSGLAAAKALVERNRGFINAESVDGDGTIITIQLPAA